MRQLRKGQTQKLIPARETLDVAMPLIPIHAQAELIARQKVHQLRENRLSKIHSLPPELNRQQQNRAK
jgi:hypothetical protein